MTFDHDSLSLLAEALRTLDAGFVSLPEFRTPLTPALARVLEETALRLQGNHPYHHPLYVGQMLKPPHPMARLAYALAMYQNPNNHALDGGRATSPMEKEAVAEIARMFGWTTHLGHLCGGGTMANFEALWIARCLDPSKLIVASELAHYTHSRLSSVLGLRFARVGVDERGRMDVGALKWMLANSDVGTVVVTLGTTAAGTVDPLDQIVDLCAERNVRIHIDAAYGGYFKLAENLRPETQRAFDAMSRADSIVIDPHKHGLQPYGCGCVLFKDPSVGQFYIHDSPYTYFTSDELHLGEISLECSRAGASAAALWATMRLLPLEQGGEFAHSLADCREAALALHAALQHDNRFVPLYPPELDIVVWAVAAPTSSQASALAREIFDSAAKHDLHLALATFPRALAEPAAPVAEWDTTDLVCLRACCMKPEHRDWMPEISRRLRLSVDQVVGAAAT